eukprot:11682978-Alexandrium_andersonii.AAC.1
MQRCSRSLRLRPAAAGAASAPTGSLRPPSLAQVRAVAQQGARQPGRVIPPALGPLIAVVQDKAPAAPAMRLP